MKQRIDSGDILVSKLEEVQNPFYRIEKNLEKVGKMTEARDKDNVLNSNEAFWALLTACRHGFHRRSFPY